MRRGSLTLPASPLEQAPVEAEDRRRPSLQTEF